jgi:hypothetical protein
MHELAAQQVEILSQLLDSLEGLAFKFYSGAKRLLPRSAEPCEERYTPFDRTKRVLVLVVERVKLLPIVDRELV